MKSGFILAALMLMIQATAPAFAQQNTEWIVLSDDASHAFAASLGTELAPAFSVIESVNGLTVARLDPALEGLLQQVIHRKYHRCGGYTVHPTREAAIAEANNPYYAPGYRTEPSLFPRTIDQQAVVLPALNQVNKTRILDTIRWLQDLGTRYYQQ
jgi:leucyl aminopeptidase